MLKSFNFETALCLFLIIISSGECGMPVKVRNCPGENPKASLAAVYIENCSQEPCVFRKGQNVTMEMDIELNEDVKSLKARLYALVLGVPVLWDGVNPDACQDIISDEPKCPLNSGDYFTYGVNLYVSPVYPTITADVKYMLLDEKQRTQICWIVKASVKPA
ncbi:unnamed protein product [Orchesella dallaii]|uniref:MD-2-related lipid-recognition domain-containing protein n=1 Tax=Orchesella dallaii TaxID=48710 RepID=A0ABP1R2J1_9HEXA